MICSCCGYEIKEKPHLLKNGKYVCDRCWNNPSLFFPEKLRHDERLGLLATMANERRHRSDLIYVKVIKLAQKEIDMYIGKMSSKDLLELCDINRFREEELEGYQREKYKERTSELMEYLIKCPVPVMPGIFVSLREAKFNPLNGDFGVLEIPRKKSSMWIIDGQHRVGGFEEIRGRFVFAHNPTHVDPETFLELMNYELPVVFIDSNAAARKATKLQEPKNKSSVTAEDVERAIFFIVNKTQKGISPSLKDALLYRIKLGGIDGIPALKKESWRIHAAFIGIMLSRDEDSPLADRINIGGKRGQGKPIMLNSFVSSLLTLFRDKDFFSLSDKERLVFVKAYWNVLREMFPEAFESKMSRDYMLLKAIGVYSLNWLANDIFRRCVENGLDYSDESTLEKLLEPLKTFDWGTQTSPLSTLGGMKGVREAHRLLLETLWSGAKEKTGPI